MSKFRKYASSKKATKVRMAACGMAADHLQGVDDPPRLMALCVFFETYIAYGATYTENTMRMMRGPKPEKRRKAPVVQLITRDD